MLRLLICFSLIGAACADIDAETSPVVLEEATGSSPEPSSDTPPRAADDTPARATTPAGQGADEPVMPDSDESSDGANEPTPQPQDPTPSAPSSESREQPADPNPTPVQPQAQIFHDITDSFVGNGSKRRYGVAVSDINGDGDFEFIVTGYGGSNEVWDYQGGRFVDIAPPGIKDADRRAIGVAACDVDGDGSEEIYFLNVDRFGGLGEVSDRLYRRSGDDWVDVFEQPSNASSVNRFSGRSVLCFDRDGDGVYGVFVANYGGPMKLFEVDEDWRLNDVAPSLGMNLVTGGRSLVNLPDDSGRMRLFAGNENGPNFFFVGQNPNYQEVAASFGISDSRETVRGVAVLDADDDGRFDLVYGNWDGPHRLFLDRGDRFEDVAPAPMVTPSRIRTVIAADFDNDGYEEIFWNQIGEPNRLFKKVDGEWVLADIGPALEPEGLGTGAAVGDIDGDGRLELFVAHGESGAQPLTAYKWGANANHYLRVVPKTVQGGPARGAVVILRGTDRTQKRVIDAGSGYLCQMEPVAHFGLGTQSSPVTLEVIWPDGTRFEREGVRPDQVVVIEHPNGR